eukprot:14449358-Ditylum_brightwellii.AAC.1
MLEEERETEGHQDSMPAMALSLPGAPAVDAFPAEVFKGEILVVGVEAELEAKEDVAVELGSLHNGEEFFIHECNWPVLLADDATELIVRGIGIDIKGLGEVGKVKKSFVGH